MTNGPPSSGQQVRIGSRSRSGSSSQTSWQGASLTVFAEKDASSRSLPERLDLLDHPLGRLELHHRADPPGQRLERIGAERHADAALRAELVDQHGQAAAGHVLEQQGRPAAGDFMARSATSVISRFGSTSARTRTSSPALSSVPDPFAQVPHAHRQRLLQAGGGGQAGGQLLERLVARGPSAARPGRRGSAPPPRRGSGPPRAAIAHVVARQSGTRPARSPPATMPGAEGDQVGQRGDDEQVARRRDAHQPVGVAVVAGQHLAPRRGGRHVARAAVVEQEALQDQVEADRLVGRRAAA